jgi:hypothetical protein
MSGFIEGENRHQSVLFPESLDDHNYFGTAIIFPKEMWMSLFSINGLLRCARKDEIFTQFGSRATISGQSLFSPKKCGCPYSLHGSRPGAAFGAD